MLGAHGGLLPDSDLSWQKVVDSLSQINSEVTFNIRRGIVTELRGSAASHAVDAICLVRSATSPESLLSPNLKEAIIATFYTSPSIFPVTEDQAAP